MSTQESPVFGQFVSKSSAAGDVYVELGFVPGYVIVTVDSGGTSSNLVEWFNPAVYPLAIAGHLLTTGSTGVRTKVTTADQIVEAYEGGDKVAADETVDSGPKHVTPDGSFALEGHITSAGFLFPSQEQVASGNNHWIAYR